MKILSYNVNGIRAASKNGLLDWLSDKHYDILCFQEVKAAVEQVDFSRFEALGYHVAGWHDAQKKGYSGVAILSRIAPDLVVTGMGNEFFDNEGRVIRADYGDITVLNCYFPSGTSGDIRQTAKMKFLDDFFEFAHQLRKDRPSMIICGDFNIAHTPQDIHDPVGNKKSSGFLPEERAWMTKWLRSGFTDAFRFLNPDAIEYSWWTYRANARNNNKGWRIDYFSVSDQLQNRLLACNQISSARHSDHCPVSLELKSTVAG